MDEMAFTSAAEIARAVRERRIGCLEVLDRMIARVERLDGALNAVVVRDFERARQVARDLDNMPESGPLHGVPMTVKESFDVAGLPTTWGYPEFRDNVATEDALAVQRLKRAGAVIFGKTNVPKSLGDWQSYNAVYGATSNPWNPDRTPGGSSGGSAAALAAGFSGLEIGSDIGGSIRVPAHFCGVFGHKPTHGLLPPRGHSLARATALPDISVIGPLARSAWDLRVALDALAGPDETETRLRFDLPPPPDGLFGLRVAVWAQDEATHTDASTVAAIEALAGNLEYAGARVSRTRPQFDAAEAFRTYLRLLMAVLSSRMDEGGLEQWRSAARRLGSRDMRADAVMGRCVGITHREWVAENEKRAVIRRQWGLFFGDYDVLLCPAFGVPALPFVDHGETWERTATVDGVTIPYNDLLFWPGITGGFHLPSTVAPIAMSPDGLPIGVQIVGPQYGDRMCIGVAAEIERMRGSFRPPAAYAD
jgi:amidase